MVTWCDGFIVVAGRQETGSLHSCSHLCCLSIHEILFVHYADELDIASMCFSSVLSAIRPGLVLAIQQLAGWWVW